MVNQLSSKAILEILIGQLEFLHENLTDASVLLVITDEPTPKILLTRRAAHMTYHAGEVSLPGGRRDKDDKSNQEVALREIYEELGLEARYISFLGELPVQKSIGGLSVTPLVALIPSGLELKINPDEVAQVFYIPLNYFLIKDTQPYIANYPHGQVEVSSIHFNDEIIWGLTARIILSLFDIGINYQKDWKFYSKEIA